MAKAKTGSFFLTETIQLPAASIDHSRIQGEIDLGAYVNVPTGQAISISEVDFIYQHGPHFAGNVDDMVAANAALSVQLTDLNPGTAFVRADDQSLVASGSMNIDFAGNVGSHTSDLYPDNYGPASLSESFLVVNDTLYLVGGVDGAATGGTIDYITVRVRCQVVKLSQQDWMSIAIQSTASDN